MQRRLAGQDKQLHVTPIGKIQKKQEQHKHLMQALRLRGYDATPDGAITHWSFFGS